MSSPLSIIPNSTHIPLPSKQLSNQRGAPSMGLVGFVLYLARNNSSLSIETVKSRISNFLKSPLLYCMKEEHVVNERGERRESRIMDLIAIINKSDSQSLTTAII